MRLDWKKNTRENLASFLLFLVEKQKHPPTTFMNVSSLLPLLEAPCLVPSRLQHLISQTAGAIESRWAGLKQDGGGWTHGVGGAGVGSGGGNEKRAGFKLEVGVCICRVGGAGVGS